MELDKIYVHGDCNDYPCKCNLLEAMKCNWGTVCIGFALRDFHSQSEKIKKIKNKIESEDIVSLQKNLNSTVSYRLNKNLSKQDLIKYIWELNKLIMEL